MFAGQRGAFQLVDQPPCDQVQWQRRQPFIERGRVERDRQAFFLSDGEDDGQRIDLVLQQEHIARLRIVQDLADEGFAPGTVRAREQEDAVLPAFVDLDDGVSRGDIDGAHEGGIRARIRQNGAQKRTVAADQAAMDRPCAGARQGDGLVQSFPAGKDLQPVG